MKEAASPRPRRKNCKHHWIIATPNGARSDGHCKRCGRRKKFPNAIDDKVWTSDGFSLPSAPKRVNIPS